MAMQATQNTSNAHGRRPHADRDLMTNAEAAEYLRIKQRQLYSWRVSGLIPYMKIGRAIRYRKAALDAALDAMSRGGTPLF